MIVIVPAGNEQNSQIEALKAKFPNGKVTQVDSNFNGEQLFLVFEVKQ
jgi:hypothetical protein